MLLSLERAVPGPVSRCCWAQGQEGAGCRARPFVQRAVRAPAGCGGFIKRKLFCSRVGPGCFGAAPQAPRRCEERGAPGGRCLPAASRGRCGWPDPALPRDSFLPGAPRFCGKCWPRAGCRSCRSEKVPRTTRLCPSPPAAQTVRCDAAHSVAGESTPPPAVRAVTCKGNIGRSKSERKRRISETGDVGALIS